MNAILHNTALTIYPAVAPAPRNSVWLIGIEEEDVRHYLLIGDPKSALEAQKLANDLLVVVPVTLDVSESDDEGAAHKGIVSPHIAGSVVGAVLKARNVMLCDQRKRIDDVESLGSGVYIIKLTHITTH